MTESYCIPKSPKFIDRTGRRYGSLVAIAYAGKKGQQVLWKCRCDCGEVCVKFGTQLQRVGIVDCGCTDRDRTKYKHLYPAEYRTWHSMRIRCYCKTSDGYQRYGAKGIRICDRWNSFREFIRDMGPKPTPQHTIDRIDGTGNYEPDNCRWATKKEQSNNLKTNRLVTIDGVTKNVTQWSELFEMSPTIVNKRIVRGWLPLKALTTPPK